MLFLLTYSDVFFSASNTMSIITDTVLLISLLPTVNCAMQNSSVNYKLADTLRKMHAVDKPILFVFCSIIQMAYTEHLSTQVDVTLWLSIIILV